MNLEAAHLSLIDWLIMLVYFAFVLGIGFSLKRYMRTSNDFFLAGRSIPAWVCGLAFLSANLGAQEVIGMGASGAKYGIIASHFYWIGAIPAMIFVGIFMMPFYYGSRARSVPEFLRLRFDEKTRALNAVTFSIMTVFSSGISMYAMALLIQNLGLFHGLIPDAYVFHLSVLLSAAIVLAYIFLGGLSSAIYNEVLQFFLIVAAFAPLVWIGLKNVGGPQGLLGAWGNIRATLPATMTHSWRGMAHPSTNSLGVEWFGLSMGLGFVLSFGYWCTDFLVIQRALAADSETNARRVPLIAAIPKMFFPFLVILPGLLAVTLTSNLGGSHIAPALIQQDRTPPPVTSSSSIGRDGREVLTLGNVRAPQPLDQAHPHGLIPPKLDPVTGRALLGPDGQPVYNYDLAIPVMLLRFFPTGMLGLGLTALLASFMSGMAGNVTAFNTVWTYDLYQAYLNRRGTDEHYLRMGRIATVGGILLSVAAAYAVRNFNNIMDALQLIFSLVNAPLFATFLLGMFSKRTTGTAAFTGLLAGTGAALVHHGLTLPAEALPGIHGGWIHVVHLYPSDMAQNFWTAIFAFTVNLVVTVLVSLGTTPRPESQLVGLVYSLTPRPVESHLSWHQRPATLAVAVLAMLVILNLIFA